MKVNKLLIICMIFFMSWFLINAEVALAEDGVTDDEITIGCTLDLSGPVAFLGNVVKHGATLYFRHINDQGGINGRKIKFLIEDDGYQAPRTVLAAKKLVTKNKIFVMSCNLGGANIEAMRAYLAENKIPLLPGAGSVPPSEYVFLTDTVSSVQASLAMKYIMRTLKPKNPKFAVIYEDSYSGHQWRDGVKSAAPKYGVKPLEISYKRGSTEMSAQVSRCKQEGITHILVYGLIREPGLIMKEAQRIQYKATYFYSNGATNQKSLELAGDAVNYSDGVYVTAINNLGQGSSKIIQFYKDLEKKYNYTEDTSPSALWGFNSAALLCEVLKRSGKNLTRENFIKAAETIKDWEIGLQPPTTFGPNRRDGGRSIMICRATNKATWIPVTGWISE